MQAPRGTNDILPDEIKTWRQLEHKAVEICHRFGYEEIRTPIFEHTELFLRGVGDVTDIVSKEMYTFKDRSERSLTLRPEGTAPVARAYMESNLKGIPQPVKLFYIGPMFRYDRPGAGRYRQFYQFGVEVFGTNAPAIDAEVIVLALDFFRSLGLSDFALHLNSVGCPDCRQEYRSALQNELKDIVSTLCSDCSERFDKNPMRILDCKIDKCKEATKNLPSILDYLCSDCSAHFEQVKLLLNKLGEEYVINPRLVRGLDYYTKTAFEIISTVGDTEQAIGGGGRYDNLVSTIGGPDTPGIGFAVGIERVLLAIKESDAYPIKGPTLDVFVAKAGNVPDYEVMPIIMDLRNAGFSVDMDYMGKSLKAQFKTANKKDARYVVVLGEEEMQSKEVTLRNMTTGSQETVGLKQLAERLETT
ncbi:histidine--tRNA ligase [Dethiobacter alkaliphilus]|uniref:Histidine--tRNA ligase n=1 Tax=Dethiobacter alkaliphilus AHT 1 TaxID=555088 RepID=C0GI31_DETAL|nr:histidine--tRNA ligase [Dethiobacter alkaliphilus]EEG77105.1 histidyl-tRNA synthetase [Dethiobacter alkaliphilus AHT 1]